MTRQEIASTSADREGFLLPSERTLSVPFYLGEALSGWAPAEFHEVIEPALPEGPVQQRLSVLLEAVAQRMAVVDRPIVYGADCMLPLGMEVIAASIACTWDPSSREVARAAAATQPLAAALKG